MTAGGRPRLPLDGPHQTHVLSLAAIVTGLLWCVGAIDVNAPEAVRVALLLAGGALLIASARGVAVGAAACAYAVAIAAAERLAREPLPTGSDVLPATKEAIQVALAGGNPYTHVLQSTIPPGSPLPYPPGELLYYLPAYLATGEVQRMEAWSGILTAAALALAGLRAGFAHAALPAMLYATWGIAAFRTIDGGNDVSAALLVTVAFVALAVGGRAGFLVSAVALGWALAFKAFAVLVFPLIVRQVAVAGASWRAYGGLALGTAAAMTLPYLLRDPGAFVSQQVAALTFHQEVWGTNLLNAFVSAGVDVAPLLPWSHAVLLLLTVAALAAALRARLETLGVAAIAAALVIAVPLLLARWTTQSYYVYAATLALVGLALVRVRVGARTDV